MPRPLPRGVGLEPAMIERSACHLASEMGRSDHFRAARSYHPRRFPPNALVRSFLTSIGSILYALPWLKWFARRNERANGPFGLELARYSACANRSEIFGVPNLTQWRNE